MNTRFWRSVQAGLAAIVVIASSSPSQAERITVAGTGAATVFLRRVGTEFTVRTGVEVEILPGVGSSGALRALGDGVLDIAVSGRPLTPEETARGLSAVFSLRTPFVFATSLPNRQQMSLAEVVEAFDSGNKMWPEGEHIRVILRPKQESMTTFMERTFPGLAAALAAAHRRPDVPLAATDQDNATLAENTPGSLVGITYLQAVTEHRNLRFVVLDGVEPTMENFDRGVYPYALTLNFVTPARQRPAVDRFLDFMRSEQGESIFRHAHIY